MIEAGTERMMQAMKISLTLLLLPAMLIANDARAEDATSLYTARVPFESSSPESRDRAYKAALSQILQRLTGSQNALLPEQVKELFPNPARYVMQYRPGEEDTLWVTLDGDALERGLRQAGYTVWGGDRPLTLVWLAVDWGDGEREIVASDDLEQRPDEGRSIDRNRLLRERVQEVAMERGVPLLFPLLDAQELESVSFSDIWGGFYEPLIEASRRYGANSILVGRIRPETVERNRWSYFFGKEQREWSGEPEEVVNLLADTLAAQFAIAGNAPLESISLTVSGVDSIAAYGAVHSFMQGLELVEDLAIDSVSGNRIRYQVKAHGGRERLQRALEFSRILAVDDNFNGPISADTYPGPAALEYRYLPDGT